jgi:hypothetical protein
MYGDCAKNNWQIIRPQSLMNTLVDMASAARPNGGIKFVSIKSYCSHLNIDTQAGPNIRFVHAKS